MPNRVSNLLAAFACLLLIAAGFVPAVLWPSADANGRILAAILGVVIGAVAVVCGIGSVLTRTPNG